MNPRRYPTRTLVLLHSQPLFRAGYREGRKTLNQVVRNYTTIHGSKSVKEITGVWCVDRSHIGVQPYLLMDMTPFGVYSLNGMPRKIRTIEGSVATDVGCNVIWYFGYASNMDLISLRAKGIEPRVSKRAVLPGWRLCFNVRHFFRHEGGVANIQRTDKDTDVVRGVLHLCDDAHLSLLDVAEAQGWGYDRISVQVLTQRGEQEAVAYVGLPSFTDERCLPSQRYINILVRGATQAQIDSEYVDTLRRHPVYQPPATPVFEPPSGDYPIFTATTLMERPMLTALAGAVFDMTEARWRHHFLRHQFGGKDMTLFHLKRLDTSDGSETLDDIKYNRLTPAQRRYLDEYLHDYNAEYVYSGRYIYA